MHGSCGRPDLELPNSKNVVDVHVNDVPADVSIDEQVDGVRCLPGETDVIDLNTLLGTLQSIGYDGPVVVEPFNARLRAMTAEDAVRTTVEALDKVWREAGLAKA